VENTQEIKHDTSIFGIGPAGFVAALELPRAELALGIMSPSRLAEHDASGSYDLIAGLAPGGMDFKYTKIAQLGELIEELALPVKPFAYFDVVTSASMVTSGMTGTMPLPGAVLQVPCENAHLVVAANVGVGAKIGFPLPHNVTSALGPIVPHQATFEPFEAAMNIYKKETVAYKNGKKCLGDP
jgi:ribulose 1,5-bisphosphate synthetase/thiazole synthase